MTTDLDDRIAEVLIAAEVENAAAEARWIAEDAADEREAMEWARRRAAGEPLQYILGSVAFRHLKLEVGPGAFIPRPETELVAGRAIELLPPGGLCVDLCTGCGPIAISIAHECPEARVLATEISNDALVWARKNLGSEPVELLKGYLFEPLPPEIKGSVDVVVANPPYVSTTDERTLPPDVAGHEPHVALFSPGNGLQVIAEILSEAPDWLRSGGSLVLEIGETQGRQVGSLLAAAGFADVRVSKDLAGRDRIAEGRRP